jgi:hypothetical protein
VRYVRAILPYLLLWLCVGEICLINGCVPSQGRTPAVAPAPVDEGSLMLRVDNQDFSDADVYVLYGDAVIQRLGTVTGLAGATFRLRRANLGPQIAFYARTIGAGTVYRSEEITIPPGVGLHWQIGPQKGASWLYPQAATQ